MAFDGSIQSQPKKPSFDDLCVSAGYSAQEAHTLLMAAFFNTEAQASASYARKAIEHFDELAPLIETLRARLANANPHSSEA